MYSHAYLPTVTALPGRIRVYLAFRDGEGIGRIGYVDLNPEDPMRVIRVSDDPVLDIGPPGTFDDNGVTPLSIVETGGEIWMYYAGWHLSPSVRYHLFTGLAVSNDGGDSFRRYANVPIIDRTDSAWLLRSGVCVLKVGDKWKCWHAASAGYIKQGGKRIPSYDWAYMESDDGIHWPDQHVVVIPASPGKIIGYGRAHILYESEKYKAWISVRTLQTGYKIGYATSPNGIHWSELDYERGLLPSGDGFDSKEVCFSSVFDVGGKRYMVYNGNDFGLSGFGLAIWEQDR